MSPFFVLFAFVCFFCFVECAWVPAKFTVTTDNAYAIYVGDSSGVAYKGSEWAGSSYEILQQIEFYPVGPNGKYDPTPPPTPLYMDDQTQSVYVVAWADAIRYQGALFNFEINGVQISSTNPLWQVLPTGYFPQVFPHPSIPTPACKPAQPQPFDRTVQFGQDNQSPPCPTWVAQQVANADANNLWQAVTLGDFNTASSVYLTGVPGIPASAQWMWYRSDQCADSTRAPFDSPPLNPSLPNGGRCHHKEPLIFRLPARAWQVEANACHKAFNRETQQVFCTGTCPQRPDGSSPQCVSLFSDTGDLKECECCGTGCSLVVMPVLEQSYCAGTCPECQQCSPKEWGVYYPNPQGDPVRYIKSCSCAQPAFSGRCEVDRCNNRCVGQCPGAASQCVPKNNLTESNGQIEECWCPPDEKCHMEFTGTTREPICVGTCKQDTSQCKGYFVDGRMVSCKCDCCDLERDPVNPLNNHCIGKCDTPNWVCNVTRTADWVDPSGVGHVITTGCGCQKPQ